MKDHLKILLSKKARIDSEILILKRSIKNKSKSFEFSLKSKINLEAFGENQEPTERSRELLMEKLPEVLPFIIKFDELNREIEELLLEDQERS